MTQAMRSSSFVRSRGFIRIACSFTLFLALALLTFTLVLQEDKRVLSAYDVQNNPSLRTFASKETANDRGLVKAEPPGRKLVWLMSFPNSGTSYTSRLIRDLTQTDSASNYADETDAGRAGLKYPVFEDMPDGPFWINKPESELDYDEPTEYVLTKTHCGIRCALCPPEKYIESTFSFRSNCLKTKWMNVNETAGVHERIFSEYDPERLTKVVHLIRDPFDNVVSRFHLEREIPGHVAEQFSEDREGFRSYCRAIDSKHKESEKRVIFLSESLLKILNRVPCHEDFIRYIEWHNLAFVTTRDMMLQSYVLHYDWYATRYTETTKELLNFLKLRIHKKGVWTPFIAGNVYSDYYTAEEKQALAQAFKMMSSVETWNHISQYFEGSQQNDSVPEVGMAPHRPPLDALVKKGSKTEIIGNVQFLLDFAIVGYPKTATSAVTRWLASQQEIQMYDHEIYYLKNNEPAEMVRALHLLPEGENFKRGYKAPRDIHNPPAVQAFRNYFPNTKLIVGLRHPVLWFESFYNFRIRSNVTLPPPNKMIGDCTKDMFNVCTEEIRYMDHLSALGKTDRTDPMELKLLSPLLFKGQAAPKMTNPIFLYEISQLEETDDRLSLQFRKDLQQYLGMSQTIGPLTEEKETHDDSAFKDLEIDICDSQYDPIHADLMDIAKKSSFWLRKYFLPSPDVHVSSPEHFTNLLEAWLTDPCVARRNE